MISVLELHDIAPSHMPLKVCCSNSSGKLTVYNGLIVLKVLIDLQSL